MNIYSYIHVYKMPTTKHNRQISLPILNEESALDVAELFRTFGDSTRIRVLDILVTQEMCVGEICELLGMSQSAVSHQLRVMRTNGLVKKRKSGRHVYYSLKDEHIKTLYQQGLAHVLEV